MARSRILCQCIRTLELVLLHVRRNPPYRWHPHPCCARCVFSACSRGPPQRICCTPTYACLCTSTQHKKWGVGLSSFPINRQQWFRRDGPMSCALPGTTPCPHCTSMRTINMYQVLLVGTWYCTYRQYSSKLAVQCRFTGHSHHYSLYLSDRSCTYISATFPSRTSPRY